MADTPTKSEPKPHKLDYAPTLTFGERVGRHLPSSEQFLGFLKTLIWVAPLTLLIWVYAEREQSVVGTPISVSIDVRTSDSNRIVTLRRPADKNIILELSGPRVRLDHIRQELRPKPDGKAAIVIDIASYLKPGGQELATVEQINNLEIFTRNGITVKSAQPPSLFVDIDTYEEIDVPIKPAPEVANLFSQTHFTPETVKLRAPKAMIENLAKKDLFVYADLANREELKGSVKKVTLDTIPVYWGARRENVHLTPTTVSGNFEIKPRDAEYMIPSVPIFKKTPADLENTIDVKYENTINNVVVSGPREQIETIIDKSFKPEAILEVTSFDQIGISLRKQLKFELPPGVTLTPDAVKKSNWEFRKEIRQK